MEKKARQSITRYKFKTDLALEFEIVSIKELIQKSKTLLTLPHRTDFYHILWIEKGTAKHQVDFRPIHVKNNSILFIGKGKVHLFDASDKYDGTLILFTDNFFCRTDDDLNFLRSTILFNDLLETTPLKSDSIKETLSTLLSLMNKEWASFADPDVLQNYLHNFLMLSDRAKRSAGFKEVPKGPDRDYALLFISLVDQHFVSVKSVKAYADMIHIPEKRLARAVSHVLGKTPKEVINDRVLLEVKRLLVHTNQSIKEIGFILGFPEPTNFIKYFRQQVGQTPSEFRESHL